MGWLHDLSALFAAKREPDILAAARKFRAEIVTENDKALREMIGVYKETQKRLRVQFKSVSAQIAAARLAGEEISPGWLYQQHRYKEMMLQCQMEIERFSRYAADKIEGQQRLALDFGLRHSQSLAAMQMSGAASWNQIPHGALQNLVGFLGDGSPLASKFTGMSAGVEQGIKDVIVSGMAMGWSSKKIASELERSYKGALNNALVVCRTETLRAYRTAAHDNYKANSDLVTGWYWVSSHSARTCLACAVMDGTKHPLSEPFIDHPAGRCCSAPILKGSTIKPWSGEDGFKKLSEADQRRVMGSARYNLWKSKKVEWSDLATRQKSKVWGDHWRPTNLKDLVKRGKITLEDVKEARKRTTLAILKPYGKPVSDALSLPLRGKHARKIKAAVAAIDKVHGDGALEKIPVLTERMESSVGAAFRTNRLTGMPIDIVVNTDCSLDVPMTSVVHEIGHLLDNSGIGTKRVWSSEQEIVLDKWRNAVNNSNAVKTLQAAKDASVHPRVKEFYSYALAHREIFARSYSQYISTRSGNVAMQREFAVIMKNSAFKGMQWETEDFKPIADAFDEVFKVLKWRR